MNNRNYNLFIINQFCGFRWRRNIFDDVIIMNGLCYEVFFGFLDGDGFLSFEFVLGFYNSLFNEQFISLDVVRFNQIIKYGLFSLGMVVKYFGGDVSRYYNIFFLYFGEVVMIDINF